MPEDNDAAAPSAPPSVEQILRSIKRVMARDDRDRLEGRHGPHDGEPHHDAGDDLADSIELGAEQPESAVLIASDSFRAPPAEHGSAENGSADFDQIASGEDGPEALTTDAATASMRRALAALDLFAGPDEEGGPADPDAASLEKIVRDMLRPMLSDWLEAHLPRIVEQQVKAEIARIAGKR